MLNKELRKHGVTDLYVCGLCTDVCVGSIYVVRMQMTDITWKGSTLAHAQEFGYRTILIEDASRGINEERVQQVLSELRQNNGIHVNSSEVNNCQSSSWLEFHLGVSAGQGERQKSGIGTETGFGVQKESYLSKKEQEQQV